MKFKTIKSILQMGISAQRAFLVSLNKEARQKVKALKEAGFSGEMTRPPLYNARKVDRSELPRVIADIQNYNFNKLSTVEGMKEFQSSTLETLHSNGYTFVDESNLSEFGEFMNMVREKHYVKAFPSNEVARLYDNMERLGISSKTMKRVFSDYLSTQEGVGDLLETLESFDLPGNRKRISSTEVRNKMEELGFVDD